jgi:hypothetical protein
MRDHKVVAGPLETLAPLDNGSFEDFESWSAFVILKVDVNPVL